MDISTDHAAARLEACRVPALQASLALLASSTSDRARLVFYGGTKPAAGAAATGALATVNLSQRAGLVDASAKTLALDTPQEGQVDGADPTTGTAATWARIFTPGGNWWADLTVSDATGDGEIKLSSVLLLQGGFVRVTNAVVAG